MDLRLLGIVILIKVTLTVASSSTTATTTPSQNKMSSSVNPSSSTVPSANQNSSTVSSANSSSSTVHLIDLSTTSVPSTTPSSSVATTISGQVVSPPSSSLTSSAAHTTSDGGSQTVSPTTPSQTTQGTEVLSNTTPSSLVKISVTKKATISPSAYSPGRTTSESVTQPQLNSSIGGTTSHISPHSQSDSLTSGASLGVSSQPGPSLVSLTLTTSSSLHQELANSTVVTTTMSSVRTNQALIPSPSLSPNCMEFTVYEKDCSQTCSNVGGTVEATEWCPSYSTVPANRKSKRTKKVNCKDYCSGTEAFRSLLSTVIVGILLFMISQFI